MEDPDVLTLGLLLAAAGVGVMHTLLGPDHYVPFVAMARARGWGWPRTLATVGICGVGHVLGSLTLGAVLLGLGSSLEHFELVEGARGDWAAWMMVACGLAYGAWGLRRALRTRTELEAHAHGDHFHIHSQGAGPHGHAPLPAGDTATFWMLLLVFVLGPCEALIPLVLLPASRGQWDIAAATAVVFALATVLSMLATTAIGLLGLERVRFQGLERWVHSLAGAAVAISGLAILTLGL